MWERTVYELVVLRVWQPWRGSKWEAVDVTPRGCFGSGRSHLVFLSSFPLRLGDGGLSSSEESLQLYQLTPQEKPRHLSPALPSFSPAHPTLGSAFWRLVLWGKVPAHCLNPIPPVCPGGIQMSPGVITEDLTLGRTLGGSPGSLLREWKNLEVDH